MIKSRTMQKLSRIMYYEIRIYLRRKNQMTENLQIQFSLLEGTTKTKPTTMTMLWQEFVEQYLLKHIVSDIKEQPLFAPCTFISKRANDQVIEHFALVLDFDDGTHPSIVSKLWDEMGLEYVLYQTFGCSPDKPKFRAVFPYSEPISAKEYERKKEVIRSSIGQDYEDKATKDPSRSYYLPTVNSKYYSKPAINVWKKGKAINPADPMFDVPEEIILPAKTKSQDIIVPSQLEWYDEWNINGYDHCSVLLKEKGWSLIRQFDDEEHWAKPGSEELHATVRFYSQAGLQMFYNFSSKAEPFEAGKAYNWSDLANILLFPEEHEKNSKRSLWKYLSKHNLVTKKAPTYKMETFDEELEETKPVVELTPISKLSENVINAIIKINKAKNDIDKMYFSPEKTFCLASRKDGVLSTTLLKQYEIAVWLEREAIITKDGEEVDGLPNAIIQRLTGISKSIMDNNAASVNTLYGFSTFPSINLRHTTDSKPHYDKQSKKIVCIGDNYQEIIRKSFASPSRERAKSSAEKIRGIFHDSPFLTENDWSKTFALIITPFLTDIYSDSIPMGVIKASQAGSGKTELGKGICAFTGRVNCKDYNKTTDTERMLTSYIIDDSRTFVLDNVNGYFEDDFISVLSTSREVSLRQLYKESITVPNNLMIIAAANNPRLSDDATSRSVEINIHVDQANPGARKTKYSILPKTYIQNNYEKCLGWVMDVLAYGLSCEPISPADYKVITRHTNWERLVQSVLNPIGIYPDFSKSKEVEEEDSLQTFIRSWYERHGANKVSVSDLARLAFFDEEKEGLLSYLTDYQMSFVKDESNEKMFYKSIGNIIGKHRNRCYLYPDNLELKITKGRNAASVFYALQVLSLPTSEITEPKQMRFDEVPALEKPEPISVDEDDDIWELDEWMPIGGKR